MKFSEKSACCVILASKGYPEKYEKGFPITLPATEADERIYIAGATQSDGKLLTSGGRVLGGICPPPLRRRMPWRTGFTLITLIAAGTSAAGR